MIDLTTVLSFHGDDGLYHHGELFIHTTKDSNKKIFIVVSDGFDDSILIQHIGKGFFQFIEDMFGQEEEYILVFKESPHIYICEIIDSRNYTYIHNRIREDGQEMYKFIETHKEYFDEQ